MDQNQLLLMLATIVLLLTSVSTGKQKPVRIQAEIMHRNAKGSPLHSPTATEHQIREEDIMIGLRRAEYMERMGITAVQGDIAIDGSSFIMKYKIGTPAIDTYGYLDTGSSLSWIQCLLCTNCYEQKGTKYYYPHDSSSFEYVTKENNQFCQRDALWAHIMTTRKRCYYQMEYRDKTKTSGYLATETLVFLNDYAVNNIVIGCSYDNERKDFSPPGLVGLGKHGVSLVNQLSYSYFSYYLHYSESSVDMVGVIDLGSPRDTDVKTRIPLNYSSTSSSYILSLKSIDVSRSSPILFPDGGIIIDTGSTYTFLESQVYDELRDILISELGDPLSSGSGELCYEDPVAPPITFRFTNYDLYICDGNLWYRNPFGRYCFAIKKSEISLLGMYQQRGLQVDFNLNEEYVSMDYVDHQCPHLDYE